MTDIAKRSDVAKGSDKNTLESMESLEDVETPEADDSAENLAILVDTSYSMDDHFGRERTKLKIAGAREALQGLWDATDWEITKPRAWIFNSNPSEIDFKYDKKPDIGSSTGGTDYEAALEAAMENEKLERIILISDGEPNHYPEEQVKSCVARGITIDTIYIGTEGSEAEKLLQRMSDETSGQEATVDTATELLEHIQQLETGNRLQLEDHSDEDDNGGGVIQL